MKKDIQLFQLVDTRDSQKVIDEVCYILKLIDKDYETEFIEKVFKDTASVYAGTYPGYKGCNCPYHDFNHIKDVFLAMARLIHGATLRGYRFSKKETDLGLLSALFHDIGLIQEEGDNDGTGAKYTLVHIERGIDFSRNYLKDQGFGEENILYVSSLIRCTDTSLKVRDIDFFSESHELMGKLLGTADLIGQISDRNYLEKLPYLFMEFKEGNVPGYKDENEFDFIKNTLNFYKWALRRLRNDLDSVYEFARDHFRERWNIDENLYVLAMERNIKYLEYIIKTDAKNYRKYLRRRVKELALTLEQKQKLSDSEQMKTYQ